MDIRAFGKGFDEFYERTKVSGVRFVRGRPGSVSPSGPGLKVAFEDTESGSLLRDEFYDMVVLAPAILPGKSTEALAKVLGIGVAYDGFFETMDENGDFVTSTREGIYLAGCSTGPKDIPDSVLEAGGAVAKALTHIRARSWPETAQVVQLSSEGDPRIGVFLCHCGSNIAGTVDVPELLSYSRTLPGVVHVQDQKYSCGASTLNDISTVLREKKVNRVVVGACSPKTHYATFQGSLNRAGLNPYLLDMANVRNMDSWVHKDDRAGALEKAKDMVRMSVLKALNMKPLSAMRFPVTQAAVVIGGGVAGITAATNLASQGFETHLIERSDRLGGVVLELSEISPGGLASKDLLQRLLRELAQSGAIVHTATSVESVTGFVGNYELRLSDGKNLLAGAIVLATGAEPYSPTQFGYGKKPEVVTSLELDGMMDRLESGKRFAIISCIGSREGSMGCSRYCCQTMIGQASRLKERGNDVTVLYKDMRSFARFGEEEYEKACREGVRFLQYPQGSSPEQCIAAADGSLAVRDELTGADVLVPVDMVVLNVGLSAKREAGDVVNQLKLSVDQAGFVMETHPKLGPAEAMVQGVLLAGTVQYPKSVRESAVQALAASAKAASIISREEIEREPFVAVMDPAKCTKCARCVPVCPYGAIKGELKKEIEFITAMCQGCGTCVAECMVEGALTQEGFTDKQVMAQIDAATELDPEKKVLIFACNWCSYAGADLAGIMKIQYPSNTRVIRTMCSGRVSQKLVFYAFSRGAGAVLVTGCHPGDCHYINANQQTLKRVERWKNQLRGRGVNPERLQLWWVSAAEARRFAEKASEMARLLEGMPPEELASTRTKVKVVSAA